MLDGFFDIPPGKVAAVVTYLQMFQPPPTRPGPFDESWILKRAEFPSLEDYRLFFRQVGQDWLWYSRLELDDDELSGILGHPLYETYVFTVSGENRALEIAWSRPIRRLWLHTCTFDHPGAVPFYVRSGFHSYRRQVEVANDPRIIGLLPGTAAPHVPLISK